MATDTRELMGWSQPTNEAEQYSEGIVARTIEEQTAKHICMPN